MVPTDLGLSEAELRRRFDALQAQLVPLWTSIEALSQDPQTIVVVPSLTVDFPLSGSKLQAYEERFLFLLLLLRQPFARLIYITSQPILPAVVDYYLGLLPGVIGSHARRRLFLLSPHDGAEKPLSIKLLERPPLLRRIRALIPDPARAHLVPFNTTTSERDLALRLGIPMYGADPKHLVFGTKSGCRRLFAEAGVSCPLGAENLTSVDALVAAVADIVRARPGVRQLMVKHDEGVSGEGNAVLDVAGVDPEDADAIRRRCLHLLPESGESVDSFLGKLAAGGIVEERISADQLESPSVQLRITPLGRVELLSTHDQLLGGPSGQVYQGCVFPADQAYAAVISAEALKVGERLAQEGVIGRFALDFIVAREGDAWTPYAIEINLRKGGTTHPFLTLQFLTDGVYDPEMGVFHTPSGQDKYFVATDNFESELLRVFTPEDIFDVAVRHGLHFDHTSERGVVFHMMAGIGQYGRLGLTAMDNTPEAARALYERTMATFIAEAERALVHDLLE